MTYLDTAMNRTPWHTFGPVRLRCVGAAAKAHHRLTHPYRALCPLPDGGVAELILRRDEATGSDLERALPLSTRFGLVTALDYGPLLLACTGIDLVGSPVSATHRALARYAFAALAPTLQAALGDPMVSDAPAGAPECAPPVAVRVQLRLPSIRLTMRLRMMAEGIHALLDSGPWECIRAPIPLPSWLSSIHAAVSLSVGSTALSLAEYGRLAVGDIVCPATTSFDVTGRGVMRVSSRRLRIRWLASHQCFEVEDMSEEDDVGPSENLPHHARHDAAPIDTADIPIRLSFSLGALSLTVGGLGALARGSLLELERGLPPTVHIEANGLPVGLGELVDLDGRLAVEITQWPHGGARSRTP